MNIKKKLSDLWKITKATGIAWYKADPFRQSAVIAYYAIFSIPALLVIMVACAGLAFGKEAVQGEISRQAGSVMGPETAKQLEDIIARSSEKESSIIATIISVITLILGATGVFGELQVSLNRIWEVKVTAKKMWLKNLKDRLFSFGLVLSIGFLLLVSLAITTALTAFSDWIKAHMPDVMLYLFFVLNFVFSLSVISVLFALMFKILPDVRIRWRNIWIGAIVTALLFILGKFALGIYFGKAHPGSTYGAAGSVVLLMLWASYSCMIVFFGAEFTKQFAVYHGTKINPKRGAELILPEEDKQMVKEKREAVEQSKD
jgi:membrane protein